MKSFLIILFFCCGITFSYANTAGIKDSVGVQVVKDIKCMKYVVEPKETLYGICTKYNVSEKTLNELNPQLKKGLKVGETIFIPLANQSIELDDERYKQSQGNKLYLVEKGDTYYSIAKNFRISVDSLTKWNQNKVLKVGDKIFVASVKTKPEIVYQPTNTENNTMPVDKDGKVSIVTVVKLEKKEDFVKQIKARYDAKGNFLYDKSTQQVLIIPFLPNLYFSDADRDISKHSHISDGQVRDMFRKETLHAIEPKGFDNIYLLGGGMKDSVADLTRIYESVTYKHQEVLENKNAPNKTHRFSKKSDTEFSEKYFAVQIVDSSVFKFFENKYNIDYFIFVNEFEIQTYQEKGNTPAHRMLILHFSIYKSDATKVAGNKCKIQYFEGTNNIHRIIRDNLPKLGKEVANEMPAPTY